MAIAQSGEWQNWRAAVAQAALERAPALLREWFPNGKQEGRVFVTGSLSGEKGRSLKVWLDKGNYKDFGDPNVKGSNLVALYAQIRQIPYRQANEEFAEQWNIPKPALKSIARWQPIVPVPDFAPRDADGWPLLSFPLPGVTTGMWAYLDADARTLFYRVRIEIDDTKQFRPITFCRDSQSGTTAWHLMAPPKPWALYGLEFLAAMPEAPVLVLEGEKTCDAARALLPDWVCVTFGATAASGKTTDWTPLLERGGRIVIWPDNDRAGAKATSEIAIILQDKKPQIVQPDTWRQGWDLADALAEGWDTTKTLEYLESHIIQPAEPQPQRPEVNIGGSDLETQSQSVWKAVMEYDTAPELVQTNAGLAVVRRELKRASRRLMNIHSLRHWLTLRFRLQRFTKEGDRIPTKPDETLLQNLLCHTASGLSTVNRVTEVPIFAPDGRLIDKEGLDKESGIYYLPAPGFEHLEDVDLAIAVATIDDLLLDFPFQDDTDKAHAVAFALTPILRLAIPGPTPLFRFEAPQPRTGKTLLMRLLARITCANIAELGPTSEDEEWKKRITAAMREDPEAVLFDNIETLEFPSVKKLLTDDFWQERVLQTSSTLRVPVLCTFGASVNNPEVSAEIMGRSLRVRLDAQRERPEINRVFHHKHIQEFAITNRVMLYSSLLAIAKAVTVPDMDAPTLGMYEPFCRRLFAILENAGYIGFLGDRDDVGAMNSDDAALKVFIEQWGENFGEDEKTTSELLYIAENCDIYMGRSEKDKARAGSLGKTLKKHRDATFGAWKLCGPVHSRHGTMWHLKATGK